MNKVLQEFREYIEALPEGQDKEKLNSIYLKMNDRYLLMVSDFQDILATLKSLNEDPREYFN